MSQTFITKEEALKNGNSVVNQDIKGDFIGKHVYANVNSMVEYILNKSVEDSDAPFSTDDIENNEYFSVSYTFEGHLITFEGTDIERQALIDEIRDNIAESHKMLEDGKISEATHERNESNYEAAISELEDADAETRDIYEWWIVDNWLCSKLKEYGQPVIDGENIWGRCTTGQAILLDYVITQICADMGILEGQESSWAKS